MIRVPLYTRAIVTLALAASLTVSVDGAAPPPGQEGDGLTREMFTDQTPPPSTPAATHHVTRVHKRRTRHDSKNYRSVHHTRRHHRLAKKHAHVAPVAATPPTPPRRNLVVGFVYWWNGWVMRTFHTKVGTVMLGTIGAKA